MTNRVGDAPEEPRSIQAKSGRAAHGRMLEIGIGSDFNLPSYGLYVEKVYGVDPSTQLWRKPAIVAGLREISEIGGRFQARNCRLLTLCVRARQASVI